MGLREADAHDHRPWRRIGIPGIVNAVKRLATHILALVLAWQVTPGLTEVMENVVHVVSTGHGAHALDDAEHSPEGDEHGCAGTFHVCQCHPTVTFLTPVPARVAAASYLSQVRVFEWDDVRADGHFTGIFRPPRVLI